MRTLLWFVACCILIAAPPNSSKEWGPWRYTWRDANLWSGIPFRSKCISSSNGDSQWAYQFRSRYDHAMDFVERQEHAVDGATTNEFNRPEAFTLEDGCAESGIRNAIARHVRGTSRAED